MTLPGFSAHVSLERSVGHYRTARAGGSNSNGAGVVPQRAGSAGRPGMPGDFLDCAAICALCAALPPPADFFVCITCMTVCLAGDGPMVAGPPVFQTPGGASQL